MINKVQSIYLLQAIVRYTVVIYFTLHLTIGLSVIKNGHLWLYIGTFQDNFCCS